MRSFSSPHFVSLVFASFISMSAMGQTAPVISVPGGGSEAAFWFLGNYSQDVPGCCSEMYPNEYWTEWPVYISPNTTDPSPTIVWNWTNNDESGTGAIQFVNQVNSGSNPGVTMQSLNPSTPGVYDITIWATVDGVASNSISVFINAPSYQTTTGVNRYATQCTGLGGGYTDGWVGFAINAFYDIDGGDLSAIDTSETLENWTAYNSSNWPAPTATSWPPSLWSGNTITDYIDACTYGYNSPPPVAWNTSSNTLGDTLTQKFWVGDPSPGGNLSPNNFEGYCTQVNEVSFYTGYGALSNISSPPGYTQGVCASGQYVN